MPELMNERRAKMKRSKFTSEESESSSMSSSMSSSSDDETDAKDLKPIKEYLSDRKELSSQLFKSVKAEKIRMMLPQILKKVEFRDLEELCATELIGMSKKRIICIINGQEMLQSSDTDETDGSGPSLEIISDTEWLSDEQPNIKLEGAKSGKKSKKKPHNSNSKVPKAKGKPGKDGKNSKKPNLRVKLEKVKMEAKEKEKEKEGESLLDLLELEMRARAIRALIRKEEEPSGSKNTTSNDTTNNATAAAASGSGMSNGAATSSVTARQANLKEQLEKIDVLMKHGEDEDLFVVINPAPTIELLSSESESEDHSKRVNQKLVSERRPEIEKAEPPKKSSDKVKEPSAEGGEKDVSKEKEKEVNASKEKSTRKPEVKKDSSNLPMSVIESTSQDKPEGSGTQSKNVDLEDGEIPDDDDDKAGNEKSKAVTDSPPSSQKIKKVKKNPNIRPRQDDDSEKPKKVKAPEKEQTFTPGADKNAKPAAAATEKNTKPAAAATEKNAKPAAAATEKNAKPAAVTEKTAKPALTLDEPIEIEDSPKRAGPSVLEKIINSEESNSSKMIDMFEDKLLEIDEIINLDDYPDDMDDLERIESNKNRRTTTPPDAKEEEEQATTSSETWASRYIQQDEVQSVIKESKIQSEIRKRLRERQRQSKLSSSPKSGEDTPEPEIPKPTGSVDEYLALKALSASAAEEEKVDEGAAVESTSSDAITENQVVAQPVSIRRKPQLVESITQKGDTSDQNIAIEIISKVVKCDEMLGGSGETCADIQLPASEKMSKASEVDSLSQKKMKKVKKMKKKSRKEAVEAVVSELSKNDPPPSGVTKQDDSPIKNQVVTEMPVVITDDSPAQGIAEKPVVIKEDTSKNDQMITEKPIVIREDSPINNWAISEKPIVIEEDSLENIQTVSEQPVRIKEDSPTNHQTKAESPTVIKNDSPSTNQSISENPIVVDEDSSQNIQTVTEQPATTTEDSPTNSQTITENPIVIEDDSLLNNPAISAQTIEEPSETLEQIRMFVLQGDVAPPEDYEGSPKSDSSDDNVTVHIDSSFSHNKSVVDSSEQSRLTVQTDLETSDLQPD